MNAAEIIEKDIVNVIMEESVLVEQASSKPEDSSQYEITESAKAWGRYRMPKIYKMPDNTIALTYSMSIDHYYDQGRISPLFISQNEGKTWEKSSWPHPGLSGMHPVVSPVFDGEYYTIPARNGIRLDGRGMPEPKSLKPHGWSYYKWAGCPQDVTDWYKNINAMRWSPKSGWTEEDLCWDHEGQFIWSYNDIPQNIPGEWGQALYLEHPIIRCGNKLFVAEYWTQYETAGGSIPDNWESYLLVSSDNGRSWKRRSTIASLSAVPAYEPTLELNHAGEFVCVIRTEYGNPSTMYVMYSKDKGHNWSEPKSVLGYGVFPQLLQLDNGVMALSYGRSPGTWISFSTDGGHSWTKPYVIIDEAGKKSSCGYTSLLALGRDTFLLAYGDIHCKNTAGEECKSILTKKITVNPV
jgi:hypothetical protein